MTTSIFASVPSGGACQRPSSASKCWRYQLKEETPLSLASTAASIRQVELSIMSTSSISNDTMQNCVTESEHGGHISSAEDAVTVPTVSVATKATTTNRTRRDDASRR